MHALSCPQFRNPHLYTQSNQTYQLNSSKIALVTVDETVSWDIISAADIWDDKSMNVSDDSEDGYVLVKQEDIVDGIACFMAAYLLSLKQTKVYKAQFTFYVLMYISTFYLSICSLC
jgi:hypothetical protein